MSDLQCPAQLLVVRHGEAVYADPDRLDDPAGGRLSETGREQAQAVASAVAERNVSHVYESGRGRAAETAAVVAERVRAPVSTRPALREFEIGELGARSISESWDAVGVIFAAWLRGDLDAAFPGGETGHDVVARVSAELGSIADAHRGETVVVVSHGGSMALALPRLAINLTDNHARDWLIGNCGLVEMSVDADGWVCQAWCGGAV